ncbi:DUF4917 family protein [Saccharicrinis aurantiacus]|uniref:DUF4917 family protein n=1 Tax=Saccharicrinis aurantiacus TaxID=1849719 RepID=UPI002490BCA3|nr:DUF4917 family protein [Saccharicrinis aurantiacus]
MKSLTIEQLNNDAGIRQWSDIKALFTNCPILLGNGFSINFTSNLRYSMLHEVFIENCSSQARELFSAFQTNNFETVLEHLETTNTVLNVIDWIDDLIPDIQNEVKEGLIESINRIHPRPDEVDFSKTKKVAKQFEIFSNIFTTNYDIYSYYIIMELRKSFGDYFYTKSNGEFTNFSDGDVYKNKHIYYLHGALFLFQNGLSAAKIIGNEKWLISKISREIKKDKYPLFISEGKSDTKLKAIRTNNYLNFCFERLKSDGDKPLVVFGQSLSEQDKHLVEVLDVKDKKIAISIWTKGRKVRELKSEVGRINSQFENTECTFFDSSSLFDFNKTRVRLGRKKKKKPSC